MKDYADIEPQDDAGFAGLETITLAQVRDRALAELTGAAHTDTRTAFATLERGGINVSAIPATAPGVRTLFAKLTPQALGISRKSFETRRSRINTAVRRFGMGNRRPAWDLPIAPAWDALLATIPRQQYRWGLGNLARYCTARDTLPEDVTVKTLRGFHDWLTADSLLKEPRLILKQTISFWNWCGRNLAGWPEAVLGSPFKTTPFMLPLEAFPESFQADVAAWETRMTTPDPFDPRAPVRALREATLLAYRNTIRRSASALVRGGHVPLEQVSGLDVLVTPQNLKTALRGFLPPTGGKMDYVHKMGVQLCCIAETHVDVAEDVLKELRDLVKRLAPTGGPGMGKRNKGRLQQFDDPALIQRLLRFPEEELARALKKTNPYRRAKGVERALAISLLIFTGIRVKNLRSLDVESNFRRTGKRVFVYLAEDETKTWNALELELPPETIALLDLFLAEHRPALPHADSRFLFPGETPGQPRSYAAMRTAVSDPLRKYSGITITPHLFRHAIAKIVAETRPELLHDLSRRLGHKSINITWQSYLGTETPAASRRLNGLLGQIRDTGAVHG